MLSEEKLILGCKENNRAAQKELFERFAPKMKGVCLRYAKDDAEAKDILQDAFLKVFNNIKHYKRTGSLEGWIKRIMINTSINNYKKNKKNNEISLEDQDYKDYSDQQQAHEDGEIDKKDINKEFIDFSLIQKANFSQEELLKVLHSIPNDFKIVFNMYFIENYKHEEIAQVLKINVNTSRTRLLRARNLIQKKLYDISIERYSR